MSKFKIEITSPPDRNNLVAEIWILDNHVCEINKECDYYEIEIYNPINSKFWTFTLDEFLEVLQEAKKRLE